MPIPLQADITDKNNVRWPDTRGYGFVQDDNTIALIRCPSCGKENYAMAVTSGKCAWCGFDANTKQ